MCGIAGILNLNGAPADRGAVERMVRSLSHRGPDGCGVFVEGAVALGHTRLSIVDLETGQQPMCSADGSVWITFNGEIFNYPELRSDLAARGHQLRTQSDTEVILALYREHGQECVRFLNGEWALALWDRDKRELFLSRDRFGIRPLFYSVVGGALIFGSEIKALFQNPVLPRTIDVEALDQLFTFWAPLSPRTLFKGVSELRPGHSIVIKDGVVREHRYWQLPEPVGHAHVDCDHEAEAERLRDLLVDATRIRLRADVPVGAYLSGGLDSTFTAAVANGLTPASLRTFSVTFDDPAYDERTYQREAVRHIGTAHDTCHCSEADIARVFPDVIWHAEKPMLRTAPAPLFLLSRAVRQEGYKVVVTGEGADELLGGYDIFKEAKVRRFCSALPGSTRRSLLLRRLYPYMQTVQAQPAAYLDAFFRPAAGDCASPFFSHLPRWELTSRVKRFYASDLRTQLNGYDAIAELEGQLPDRFATWPDLARAEYLETAHLLPGYLLSSQGDRMGMAHGVEGRFPFLDHRVAELAATLPSRLKMNVLNEKYLLKRAARGFVPSSILTRKKQPYRAPDARCFLSADGVTPDYVIDMLSPSRLREYGFFNPPAVERLVAKARRGDALSVKDNMSVVGILSTQLLVNRFIEAFPNGRD